MKRKKSDLRHFYGTNACFAILKKRAAAILKVYVDREREELYAPFLDYAQKKKIFYKIVGSDDLERLTDSGHHQGICVVAKEYSLLDARQVFAELAGEDFLVYLDRVGNPHNIGAILRTAAHFQIPYVLGDPKLGKISPAACRTAEGAAEFVELVRCENPVRTLQEFKKRGFTIAATSLNPPTKSLHEFAFPKKTLLIFGSEVEGVSPELEKMADYRLQIPGSGFVQSLNVSATVAIFLNEYTRQKA